MHESWHDFFADSPDVLKTDRRPQTVVRVLDIEIGGDEGGHPRLLAPYPCRPHRIARHADDTSIFAEQIKRLDGFFGQADDSLRRKHRVS